MESWKHSSLKYVLLLLLIATYGHKYKYYNRFSKSYHAMGFGIREFCENEKHLHGESNAWFHELIQI